jgi:hypothetical protein
MANTPWSSAGLRTRPSPWPTHSHLFLSIGSEFAIFYFE